MNAKALALLAGGFATLMVGCSSSNQQASAWSKSYSQPLTPHTVTMDTADTARPVAIATPTPAPAPAPAPQPAPMKAAPSSMKNGFRGQHGVHTVTAIPGGELRPTAMQGEDMYSTQFNYERVYTVIGQPANGQTVALAHFRLKVGSDILATSGSAQFALNQDSRLGTCLWHYQEYQGDAGVIPVRIDGSRRQIYIGNQAYQLDQGNFFRVDLRKDGMLEVTQRPIVDSRPLSAEEIREDFLLYSR